ncbi:Hypp3286 [Branchiostoma lanceolatum]|uniref:Hypp3286 protein n=1 Tax=Branchiostoma lanceolatum TaxID=7740 RepID=A0A8K0A0Z3_BRALA|nr:Hypp3286 [Branchiostoma lanceolatum]
MATASTVGFKLLAVCHILMLLHVEVSGDLTTVNALNRRIARQQVLHDEDSIPGQARQKGLYHSEIRLNFHGPSETSLLRDIGLYDNNAFATLWIVTCLLESHTYGTAPAPDPARLQLAVDAINTFHSKNLPGDAAMDFWPQVYNQTTGVWEQSPENLLQVLHLGENDFPWNTIKKVLLDLGLEKLWKDVETMHELIKDTEHAYRIPPDFDDSFLNLGLGAQLLQLKDSFPAAYQSWASNNTDLLSLQTHLKTYAYRPLSKDNNANTIDPRTYYYMRPFIEKAVKEGDKVALVTTWIQNLAETREMSMAGKGVVMPFYLNNVDVTVAANTLAGITEALLAGLVKPTWFDQDLQRIYLNTTAMISWAVTSEAIFTRPDLVMTYYPSLYNFLWYSSRTLFLLQSNQDKIQDYPDCVKDVQQLLTMTFRDHVTPWLVNSAQTEIGSGRFFDDFLGDGDKDILGRPKIHGEDRIFSTAQAVNTLLATWTTFNTTSKKLVWINETRADVKTLVSEAVSWLEKYTLSGRFKTYNAFFSGSTKGLSSLPFLYPANFLQYVNGTALSPTANLTRDTQFIAGVTGVIDPDEYRKMVDQPHFGYATPTKFDGFNGPETVFPFWSSEPYTYATVMLALAQYDNIA